MTKNALIEELKHLSNTFGLLARSQLGYDLRQLEKPIRDRMLQAAVGGGKVIRVDGADKRQENESKFLNIDLSNKLPTKTAKDIADRAKVVFAGIEVFSRLAMEGVPPGYGGYEVVDNVGTKNYPAFSTVSRAENTSTITVGPVSDNSDIVRQQQPIQQTPINNHGVSPEEEVLLRETARKVGVIYTDPVVLAKQTDESEQISVPPAKHYNPTLPKNYQPSQKFNGSDMNKSRERRVPSTRASRFYNFGALAFRLGTGAAAELIRRKIQPSAIPAIPNEQQSPFLTSANMEKIVKTLCKVRGAALKLGQMLSIQDESTIPRHLLEIFERVRNSADYMPFKQVDEQMTREFDADWRQLFKSFDERPFAAASIGQVHKAVTHDGHHVAVKVQYPGVADGIDADVDNMLSVLKIGNILPKGMFLQNFASVARRELKEECDYEREARAMIKFRQLLRDDPDFYVPGIFPQLSTKRVLTAELVEGKPVDLCENEPKEVRDWIATKYLDLCLREIFEWRFMQSDPNWSNFLFGPHPETQKLKIILLDFGATRKYSKDFIDKYIRVILAAYNKSNEEILKWSREIGFLTGYESKVMEQAHCDSITIIAETLTAPGYYDFSKQDIISRVNKLIPVMIEHRLTPPPEEVYSLHRKLSGSFLLAAKLRACVACGGMFQKIAKKYTYGGSDEFDDINI